MAITPCAEFIRKQTCLRLVMNSTHDVIAMQALSQLCNRSTRSCKTENRTAQCAGQTMCDIHVRASFCDASAPRACSMLRVSTRKAANLGRKHPAGAHHVRSADLTRAEGRAPGPSLRINSATSRCADCPCCGQNPCQEWPGRGHSWHGLWPESGQSAQRDATEPIVRCPVASGAQIDGQGGNSPQSARLLTRSSRSLRSRGPRTLAPNHARCRGQGKRCNRFLFGAISGSADQTSTTPAARRSGGSRGQGAEH